MRNISDKILENFTLKDRTELERVIVEQLAIIDDFLIENTIEVIEPEIKFNTGYKLMVQYFNEAFERSEFGTCIYILQTLAENANIKLAE